MKILRLKNAAFLGRPGGGLVVAGGWGEEGDLDTAWILPGRGDGNAGHLGSGGGTWFELPVSAE